MALIITPEEIASATGLSVSIADTQNAQDVIEVFAGRAINDAAVVAELTAADLRRLRLAVQWQAVYLAAHPEILTREAIRKASANGASLERDGDGLLSPLSGRWLRSCSWVAGTAGIQITTLRPSLPYARTQPDPWVRIG